MIIRRELRALMRASPTQILDRIREVESSANVSTDTFIDILSDSIKTKSVELSLLALRSFKSFVESDLMEAKWLQPITDTVTKIEFTSTDSELVEEGYHQAVRLCRSLLKCHVYNELTNVSISEIIIFCFRVFNSKLVKWLRWKSSRTLITISRILFRRLADFPDDPNLKPSYQIRLRLGGASSQSTFKELADQFSATENSSALTSTSSSLRIINERNQPYNLAFINDFFCYLASMINPSQEPEPTKQGDERILLGLELLRTAYLEAANEIGIKSCLLFVTRNNICYNLISILKSNRSSIIMSNALNLAIDIFVQLRTKLKYQFEAFLERLMEMVATKGDNPTDQTGQVSNNPQIASSTELRSDVLNAILELFINIDHLPYELYHNFDCDPYSSNIYENLVQICSKNCFVSQTTDSHFTPVQLTSFRCLLANLNSMHSVERGHPNYCYSSSINPTQDLPPTVYDPESNQYAINIPSIHHDLIEAKRRKRLLWQALDKFNMSPKKGIESMKEQHLIDNNSQLVDFLKDNLRVDKKVLGDFLAKEENKSLRDTFIQSLDFSNLRLDEALRNMLEKFRLPGESQLIERILDSFSAHWFEQNPNIVASADSAMSLAYAIIMLNVDQHSKKVKPMTCDEFDRNLSGPKGERIYERQLLDQIYTNIRDNEIVLPDEQFGPVRQRYLWKCIMIKTERLNRLYWTSGEPETNQLLFEIMWSPTIAALSFIFEKIEPALYPELSLQIIDSGFTRIADLCAKHGHLDNLITSLCKFSSSDLCPVPHSHHSGQKLLMSDKNSLAARSLLSIIRDHGHQIGDSWSHIVRNLLHWFCSRSIDGVLQIDDFALQHKFALQMREVKKSPSTMNQQSSTFLRSVLTYFASQPSSDNGSALSPGSGPSTGRLSGSTDGGPHSLSANNSEIVNEPSSIAILLKTIQDAEYSQESLCELIGALLSTTFDGDPEEVEDSEVFKLEIFTQVVLNNKDQVNQIWPKVRAYFVRLASICGHGPWLGERIISAAFRISIQLRPKPEVFSLLGHLIQTLEPEIIRGDHTFAALTTLTELQSVNEHCDSMDARELECCFNQVIFPFVDKLLEACDPVKLDRRLNRAINLLSKIFLKHHKLLKDLPTFPTLWYAILDTMEKYIKANGALKEATFEMVKNMVLVMDNERCMSVEMKDSTRTKFMFWEFHS